MRHVLFCVAFMFSAASQAFTMSAQHCDIFHDELSALVAQKAAKVKLEDFKKYLEKKQKASSNPQAFKEIIPFIDVAAKEYYENDELEDVDYASVVGYNCRRNIGRNVKA